MTHGENEKLNAISKGTELSVFLTKFESCKID